MALAGQVGQQQGGAAPSASVALQQTVSQLSGLGASQLLLSQPPSQAYPAGSGAFLPAANRGSQGGEASSLSQEVQAAAAVGEEPNKAHAVTKPQVDPLPSGVAICHRG